MSPKQNATIKFVCGEMFHKTYTIVLPTDIPRSPLMATILERARTYKTVYTSYAIWWPPPWWNYSWPWWPYWVVPYRYSYSSEQTTFTSLPLTYVKATTPEYVQLKSEYDSLSESYSILEFHAPIVEWNNFRIGSRTRI